MAWSRVVSTDFQPHHLVHLIASAGHDDQAAAPVFAQLPLNREAVFSWQAQIEKHQGRWIVGHQRQQRAAGVQLRDAVAVTLQVRRERGPAAGPARSRS
jgi:hypothetical protein